MSADRRHIVLLLGLTLALFAAWLWHVACPAKGTQGTEGTKGAVTPRTVPADARFTLSAERAALLTNGWPLALQLNAATNSAARDVEVMHGLVQQFLIAVKEPHRPPLGINEDFAKALTGDNGAGLVALPGNHPAFAAGRIVDRWGTPYHFHARAADAIDVRSAGPDRKLFTGDDIPWPVPP